MRKVFSILFFTCFLFSLPVVVCGHTVDDPFIADLIAGGGNATSAIKVGDMKVWNDETAVYVKYEVTAAGWCITETHLEVATSLAGIPQKNGNPVPGQFSNNSVNGVSSGCVTEHTETTALNHWTPGTNLFIAAHAKIFSLATGKYATAWGAGIRFPGKTWATYFLFLPGYIIEWANLQWPPTLNHTISAVNRTDNVYGQVWIDGVTNQPGQTPTLRAQLGFGPTGSDPATSPGWVWAEASFNVDAGNNDEFVASLLPETIGIFDYAYRYTTTNGADWVYADLDGTDNGYSLAQAGKLTVSASGDTTPPATPTGLHVVSASLSDIELAWDAVTGDPSLYGYEVLRSDVTGGPYTMIARVSATSYIDIDVVEGKTYYYIVRSVDLSFNRSGNFGEVSAPAELRTVTLIFNVTVPATTDATGRSVYIAGNLSLLDGGLPDWNPGGVVLTRVDATHWTITLTGKEGTQIEYKYTLGGWDYVEKDGSCGEIANRQLTLSYGSIGIQTINDTVVNWRNVAPCGN
jgi:hypothetical protein